eukprot:CAMPEP_0172200150 /NCGR_PEP_ID=MMETSP1050-20130122/29139_1 /TAXON_ID=233186 /ORGANISM="Cryptomonas curvata, Strain CCAP979/52" /LENGTH=621 /DNA_ID=CAMNT_0012877363 /DNA_START=469 /DNA_END=2335 /DNA_ORIENTATION=-
MHFVNRNDAVKELREIHRHNYNRAKDHSGAAFVIPLCDHVVGLGKSEFGRNYLRQCRVEMEGKPGGEFDKVLYACHSIEIMFAPESLTDEDSMDQVIMENLCLKIESKFKTTPKCVSKSFKSSTRMLIELSKEIGPIFIVLDEMGVAFEKRGDSSQLIPCGRFLTFCNRILASWFLLKNVFFLVLGRAAFSSYVGQRPENAVVSVEASRHLFRRLPLRMLCANSIELILKHTLLTEECATTLAEYYKLDDSKIKAAADHLFCQTNGHPRTLMLALEKCKSYQDLMEYVGDFDVGNWDVFCQRVLGQKSTILELLEAASEGKSVNMARRITVQGRSMSYDEVAATVLMSWDGCIESATVHAIPSVHAFLSSFLMPFETFFQGSEQAFSNNPLNYPDAFELLLMKRFQQMFSKERVAKDVNQGFFNTEKFGNTRLSLAGDYVQAPKITKIGMKRRTLTCKRAGPDAWPSLLKEIDNHNSICLKPASESASPDIIFATNGWLDSKAVRVKILIVAKICHSTELTEAGIEAEIEKADKMFDSSLGQSPCGQDVLNVLFICATRYGKSVMKSFTEAKHYFYKSGKIDEVIVLDLTTKENRDIFFGVSTGDWASNALEEVISKAQKA